jgi:protein kinase-like protein
MICEGWEGLTVDGRFPLLEWLGGWADRCVFLTVRQSTHTANIKLIQASGADAEACVAKWEAAKTLPHPCLVQMMETGSYRLNGTDVAYVLSEKADTFLSGIVPRKALDGAKVKEILSPVVDALAFVHENGFVHGSVKPSSIALIGDQWKLSSDEMARAGDPLKLNRDLDTYDAPEVGGGAVTSAADMWSLGMIVVEACSQRTPVWDRNTAGDLGVPDFLPQPFREIARECIRWDPAARISIGDVKELLARTAVESATSAAAELWEPEVCRATAGTAVATEKEISSLSERVAAVRVSEPDEFRPAARGSFGSETDELTPRTPRLFSDMGAEEDHGSRTGPVLFSILVLLVIALVLGIRYKDRILPLIAKQNAPAMSQQTPQTEAPQNPAGAAKPDQEPAQSASQNPPPVSAPLGSGTASQSQPAEPTTDTAKAPAPPVPDAQTTADSSEAKSQPLPEEKEPAPKAVAPAPRVMNAKGAVVKRVLPNVAPGALQSMRRRVQVDVRVSVNSSGTVSSAQSVTQSRGNYWARISQQAAEEWKFKAPVSDGQARSSYWMLLFEFDRGRTNVIATQLR